MTKFRSRPCIIGAALLLSSCAATETVKTKPAETLPLTEQAIRFVALGDHGYVVPGKPRRSGMWPVANSINENCAQTHCDFALLLGDNIYPKGADGSPNDAQLFQELFIETYGKLGGDDPDFRIYATLGNHDWQTSREGAESELTFMETTRPFYMDGFDYTAQPAAGAGEVEIFVIDTTMLLATQELAKVSIGDDGLFSVDRSKQKPGGPKRALPNTNEEMRQVENLAKALEQSTAKWKFVIGHHPLWESNGQKADQALKMRELLLPMLCANADAFFAGHQHTLEVHSYDCPATNNETKKAPLLHIVSGAAGKTRDISPKVITALRGEPGFNHIWAAGETYGYFTVEIAGDEITLTAISAPKKSAHDSPFTHSYSGTFSNRE